MSRVQAYRSHEERRAVRRKWMNVPPGMTPELADEFIRRLTAGDTLRKITSGDKRCGPAIVTHSASRSIANFIHGGLLLRCAWRRQPPKLPTS